MSLKGPHRAGADLAVLLLTEHAARYFIMAVGKQFAFSKYGDT